MIWRGTTPTLYIIKITRGLAEGRVPGHVTEVLEYSPLDIDALGYYGMIECRNRILVFHALENLKDLIPLDAFSVPETWKRFLTPEETQLFVFEEIRDGSLHS